MTHTDVLLMNTFKWEPSNLGFLWAVLHYDLLMTITTVPSEDYKCGYKRSSDEFGGLTHLEGRAKLAVPMKSISKSERDRTNVLLRCAGGQQKFFP